MLKRTLFFLFSLLIFSEPASAWEGWGEELTSLRYIMPVEGFLRTFDGEKDNVVLGLKDFGLDLVQFKDNALTRVKTYRFKELIDPSVGLKSFLQISSGDPSEAGFLIVTGIQNGFLALDLKEGYPSERSKNYGLIFRPDSETHVTSATLKAALWKKHLLLLTADQLVILDMKHSLEMTIRAQIPLAPDLSNWRDYWGVDMAIDGDDLYFLAAHRKNPVLGYLRLSEAGGKFQPTYFNLPRKRYYLKSLELLKDKLFVSQNKSLLVYQRAENGDLTLLESHEYPYYIEAIKKGFGGLGVAFWQSGFAFFEDVNLNQEKAIIFPPKNFNQLDFRENLLFASAGEEGFIVYQKHENQRPR